MAEIEDNSYLDDPVVPANPTLAAVESNEVDHSAYDGYIQAEVRIVRNGIKQAGTVVARKRDNDNRPIGKRHLNPLLDTREYVVNFTDGSSNAYSANVIAEGIFSQVDEYGRTLQLIDEITDHQKDASAVSADNAEYSTRTGKHKRWRTTKGWYLNCLWKDGSLDWIPLKDLKESHPIQVAEYAINNKLVLEPAFAWWVPHTLKKRNAIISKVKTRYWKRMHKYGVRIP